MTPFPATEQEIRAMLSRESVEVRRVCDMTGIDFIGAGGSKGADWNDPKCWGYEDEHGDWWTLEGERGSSDELPRKINAGDVLYVQEDHYVESAGNADGTGRFVLYRATDTDAPVSAWTPAEQMPEWASRLKMRVESVRCERLQAITPKGAIAAGCMPSGGSGLNTPEMFRAAAAMVGGPYPRGIFAEQWDRDNPAHPWASNPFCFVYVLKPLEE